MNVLQLIHCDRFNMYPAHQHIFSLFDDLQLEPKLVGYVFKREDSYYHLSPIDSTRFPYPCLVLESEERWLGLDCFIVANNVKDWPAACQAKWIGYAMMVLNSRKDVIALLELLGVHHADQHLNYYLKVSKLPKRLLDLSIRKKIGMKQLIHCCRYDLEYVYWFCDDVLSFLDLSATHLMDFLERIHDVLKRFHVNIDQASGYLKLDYVKNESMDNQRRIKMLRDIVQRFVYPEHHKYNNHIAQLVKQGSYPEKMRISWDQTLENMGVQVTMDIRSEDDLDLFLDSEQYKKNIKAILKEMRYE